MLPLYGKEREMLPEVENDVDRQYLGLVRHIFENGVDKDDRTGTGVRAVFGYEMRFDLQKRYPLLTTKKVHFKSVAYDLLWMLKGLTNIGYLHEHEVTIWDEWADKEGELGPVYGKQWRSREGAGGETVDQIAWVVDEIKRDPNSRRLIVDAWNPVELPKMALPPCPTLFQFDVTNGKLSCDLYQRSADVFLGLPYNIASYSLLTMMVAHVPNLEPGELVHSIGNAHIYNNHREKLQLQLTRPPKQLPRMVFKDPPMDIFKFDYHHFDLQDYHPHPHISGKVAV